MLSQAPLADFIIAVLAGFVKIHSEQRKPTTVNGRRFRATISRQVLFSRPHEPAGHILAFLRGEALLQKRLPTPHRKTFCTKGWGKYLFVRSRRCIADRGRPMVAPTCWRFPATNAAIFSSFFFKSFSVLAYGEHADTPLRVGRGRGCGGAFYQKAPPHFSPILLYVTL